MLSEHAETNVLVAGGAGFIGANLCRLLLAKGHRVCCVDNFCTGSRGNIDALNGNKNFSFIEADVCEPLLGRADIARVDILFNLASPASPKKYQADPLKTLFTNVVGTKNLLDVAHAHGATFVQASTSEVYGDPAVHPQDESYWGNVNPIGPRACYDEGKRAAESLVFDYRRTFGLCVKVARIFNTYGPYMDVNDGRVISNFIVEALQSKKLTIYGEGNQTRSFCYVEDLVRGLYSLAASDAAITGPINLGNPSEIRIKDLAQEIARVLDCPVGFEFSDLPEDDPTRRKPDITKARECLNWEPLYSLERGLRETAAYFKEACEHVAAP